MPTRKSAYDDVLRMISAGATDSEIVAKYPEWRGNVLEICHKIVDDTLTDSAKYEVGKAKVGVKGGIKQRSEEDIVFCVKQMLAKGWSRSAIAENLHVSFARVKRIAKQLEGGGASTSVGSRRVSDD